MHDRSVESVFLGVFRIFEDGVRGVARPRTAMVFSVPALVTLRDT